MTRTILIVIGILAALLTAAGIMWYHSPTNTLRRQLHDKNPEVRASAIWEIAYNLHDKTCIPAIRKMINDANENVRMRSMSALAGFNDTESIPLIRQRLNDSSLCIRMLAAGILRDKFADTGFIPAVRNLLNDPNASVRKEAIKLLIEVHNEESVPEIRKLLEDENVDVSNAAVSAVIEFNDKEAIPLLKKRLHSKEARIRLSTEYVLNKLGVPAEEIEDAKKGE